jgi:4-hydroxy-2-oxoheptanedioate aldolase
MKNNPVRQKLKRGEPSIGTWLTLPDPFSARLMTRMGFDWLTVELEHTPTTMESAAAKVAVIAEAGCVPLVRIPWNSGENIKRVLDTGAWGIVVPMVNSRAEAEAVVEHARYRPIGKRTVGTSFAAPSFATDAATYYAKANDEILVVVMTEHIEAVEHAEEIMSVPGIDAVFIGPNDLHASMNQPPGFDSDNKQFTDAVAHILNTAKKNKIAAGIHVPDVAHAQRRIREGFQFIAVASETGMMLAKAKEVATALGLSSAPLVAKY